MPRVWEFPAGYYQSSLSTLESDLARVPFYRSWRKLDPGPEFPVDARFAALPALTKKNIREHFPGGMLPDDLDLARGLSTGEVTLVETSGTTDDKITNIWDQKWWDASERASWKLNSFIARAADGDCREAILANPRNVGIISDEVDLPFEKRRLARFLFLNEKTDPTAWSAGLMDRMIAELGIYRPAVLEANPSLLARLCRYAFGENKKVFQPAVITFTYEYPTIHHYRQISRVFSAPLCGSYGTTETGYVFIQCEKGKYHQNTDFCRVDFEPFKPEHGGPLLGRILVTPFNNRWSNFLRFDVKDLVYIEESGGCPCGRNSGLILSSLGGRAINLTVTCSGRLVSLYELDNAISILEGVLLYKLLQTGAGRYELHLVSPADDRAKLAEEASGVLKGLYGPEAEIGVIFEKDIAPESSGKYLVSRALFPIDLESCLDLPSRSDLS
jgi:phenylacetate-coenzyme A ligase PaaK-like adenylate-forming protein